MEYQILTSNDSNLLMVKVKEAIAKGWRPQGGCGPALDQGLYISQAMVKD